MLLPARRRLAPLIVVPGLVLLSFLPWRSGVRAAVASEALPAGLVEQLVATRSAAARAALLAEHPEAVTPALFQELIATGVRLAPTGGREALPAFEAALAVAERLGDKAQRATALTHVGLMHVFAGDLDGGEAYQRQAEALAAEGVDERSRAYVWSRGAELYHQRGEFERSRDYIEKSRVIFEKLGDVPEVARATGNLARIALSQGAYGQAAELYARSYEIVRSLPPSSGTVRALSGLGAAQENLGEYALALEAYEKALALAESVGDPIGRMDNLEKIGRIHRLQGDDIQALDYAEKALRLAREVGRRPLVGVLLESVGAVHEAAGRLDQAADYYRQSLSTFAETGSRGRELSATLALADLALRQAHVAESLELYRKALEGAEATGTRDYVAASLAGMAEIHRRRDEPDDAVKAAARAAGLAGEIGARETLWRARLTQGRALLALGRMEEAHQALDESIRVVEGLRSDTPEILRHSFLADRLAPYHEAIAWCVTQGHTRDALAYAERAKARALFELMRGRPRAAVRSLTPEERTRERDLLARLRDLNVQVSRELTDASPSRERLDRLHAAREEARQAHAAFETSLHAAHPELWWSRPDAPDGEAGRLELPGQTGTAVLEFVVTDTRTYLFVVTSGRDQAPPRITVHVIALTREQLQDEVRRFRDLLATRQIVFARDARRLYDRLIAPAEPEIAGARLLALIPDDVLWELPFQALRSRRGRYVVDDRAVFSSPSLSVLRELLAVDSRRRTPPGRRPRLLAMGNPLIAAQVGLRVRERHRDVSLDPLPEAEREVEALREAYGRDQSRVYVRERATEETLKAEMASYDVVHLAAHAVMDDRRPLYSSIVLSRGGEEDGLLEAWEIEELPLQARLVVLSACETGRGRLTAGEGVVGMSWALLAAGASSAVVSHWNVDSAATARLMVEFHRQMLASPVPKAEALRRAARKLLGTARYRHPFYWAGFFVIGAGS